MNISPFDLHVLSTPPAFILSQDQTLKIVFILTSLNWHFLSLLKLGFVRFSENMSDSKPEIVLNHLESSGLHCCSTVKVQLSLKKSSKDLTQRVGFEPTWP